MQSCSVSHIPASQVSSKKLRDPFLLKIDPESLKVDNYTDGIVLDIVCECSFWVFSFWGVSINEFHHKLALDWDTLRNQLVDGNFIGDNARYSNDLDLYKDQYRTVKHRVQPPPSDKFDLQTLGIQNRDSYPLVVMLVLNDTELEQPIEGDDIVLLVSIIHLKDNIIPLETSVMSSLVKRKAGTVLSLHSLYLSGNIDENNAPCCVVCFTNPISLAFLPCRHTCVCAECYPLLIPQLCPLCRMPIERCFSLEQSTQEQQRQQQQPEASKEAHQQVNSAGSNSGGTQNRSLWSSFKRFFY